jgi:flagellar hook-length control protein FliK
MEIPFLQVASKQDHASRTKPGQANDANGRDKTGAGAFQDAYDAKEDRSVETEKVKNSGGGASEEAEIQDTKQAKSTQTKGGEAATDKAQTAGSVSPESDDPVVRGESEEAEITTLASEAKPSDAQPAKKSAQKADMAEVMVQQRLTTTEQKSAPKNAQSAGSSSVLQPSRHGVDTPGEVVQVKGLDVDTAGAAPKASGSEITGQRSGTNTSSTEVLMPSDAKTSSTATQGIVAGQAKEQSFGIRKTAAEEADLRARHTVTEDRQAIEGRDTPKQAGPNAVANTAQAAQATTPAAMNGSFEQAKPQTTDAQFIDLQPVEGSDVDYATFKDVRTATPASLAQILSRPETPGQIARQLAEASQRMQDQSVQIALNPKELGKVKMMISALDGAVTVNVVAERPETLDLMRRNVHELVREFHELGYETVNFSFAEGQSRSGAEKNDSNGETRQFGGSAQTADTQPANDASIIHMIPSDGLDLRL